MRERSFVDWRDDGDCGEWGPLSMTEVGTERARNFRHVKGDGGSGAGGVGVRALIKGIDLVVLASPAVFECKQLMLGCSARLQDGMDGLLAPFRSAFPALL